MKNSKLLDKASRLDFSKLPGSSADSTATDPAALPAFTPRPKTAPGALMAFANDTRSELLRENETLREPPMHDPLMAERHGLLPERVMAERRSSVHEDVAADRPELVSEPEAFDYQDYSARD